MGSRRLVAILVGLIGLLVVAVVIVAVMVTGGDTDTTPAAGTRPPGPTPRGGGPGPLRAGARFHDGKPVTAQDFKYSMERAMKPATLSTTADTYLGDIVGAQQVLTGRAPSAVGIEVADDRTLRLPIDAPKPFFLAK